MKENKYEKSIKVFSNMLVTFNSRKVGKIQIEHQLTIYDRRIENYIG